MPSYGTPQTMADWRNAYRVVSQSKAERISFALWHSQTFTSGAANVLNFFTVASSGITGNIALAGQLSSGAWFLVRAIRLAFVLPPSGSASAAFAAGAQLGSLNDLHQLLYNGHARIVIGDKEYGRWPNFMLPAGGGAWGGESTASVVTATNEVHSQWANNGVPDPRVVYSLPCPLVIPPQFPFRVTVEWPSLTLNNGNTTVFCVLDGEQMRPSQ